MDRATLAGMIDQTLLTPTISAGEARAWCLEQRGYGFAALCVAPLVVEEAVAALAGTGTPVCAVVGFPLGFDLPVANAFHAARLVEAGALEIDMVLPIGQLVAGDDEAVFDDIAGVVQAVRAASDGAGLVKVILETGYLDDEAVVRGCTLAEQAAADFVKTSTGFGPGVATVHHVALMRETVGDRMGVKASGGIRTTDDALALIEAGASRIGTSAGATLLDGLPEG